MEEKHKAHPLIVRVVLFGICEKWENFVLINLRGSTKSSFQLTFIVEVVGNAGMCDFHSNLKSDEAKWMEKRENEK